ncbi:hypothetical protein [Streptomyces sp. NPDC051776]|uniref:hypothetical protein n=1 Tax=Streptomyces sp. NPDC051776 TaxID=3155414 RepID=UPI00341588B5
MAAGTTRRVDVHIPNGPGGGARLRGSASAVMDEAALPAPRCELLAVIGPMDARRTALLTALAKRCWPQEGAEPGVAPAGEAHRVAVVRRRGPGAPDPRTRVADLLAGAGQEALAVTGLATNDGAGHGALSPHTRYEHLPVADQLVIALALALAAAPNAVVVDAADDGLDATGRHRVWSRLRRVAESGTTVVAASDSAAAAGLHAHRTVLLPAARGIGATTGAGVACGTAHAHLHR